MKVFFGLALIVAGFTAVLYFGIWWAFIGGIVSVIGEVRAPHMDLLNVACGVARVIFAGPIGWLCGIIPLVVGTALLKD